MNISWAHLGETGLTFFFRSAQAKRQKLWVCSLEIPHDTKNKTKKLGMNERTIIFIPKPTDRLYIKI
jgi:hypothetical protein